MNSACEAAGPGLVTRTALRTRSAVRVPLRGGFNLLTPGQRVGSGSSSQRPNGLRNTTRKQEGSWLSPPSR